MIFIDYDERMDMTTTPLRLTPSAAPASPRRVRPRGAWLVAAQALLLAALLSTTGCNRDGAGDALARERAENGKWHPERDKGKRLPGIASAENGGYGDKTQAADDDPDGPKNYWKGVRFDTHNFEEVLDYVETYYIDDKVDRQKAWIAAANQALLSLDPPLEVLPAAFHQARAGHDDEEGRLDGRTEPFECNGKPLSGVVVHHVPDNDYLRWKRDRSFRNRRLSDEEILELREKSKQRYKAYHGAWAKVGFGRKAFDCVMKVAAESVAAWKKRTEDAREQARVTVVPADKRAAAQKAFEAAEAAEKAERAAKKDTTAATAEPAAGKAPAAGKGTEPHAKQNKTTRTAKRAAREAQKRSVDGVAVADGGDEHNKKNNTDDEDDEDEPRFEPSLDRAWRMAASGYLYALDPHSAVVSRRQWDDATRETQDASFEGIGAVLTQRNGVTIVENPMEGRPAWKAGVRAGDRIVEVDHKDVRGWALHRVVKLIRGPKDTIVTLTVEREGHPDPVDIAIKRQRIEMKNVSGKLIKGHPEFGYVKMVGFVPRSYADIVAKIEELERLAPGGKLRGLILDLRNDSGGLLNQAIDIADLFLSEGRIVSVRNRRRPEEVHVAEDTPSDRRFPLVVLVDDGSASASEIVAAAIQDNGRGLVLGQRTFGKGSVQTLFEPALHPEYFIKLTIARYYTPSGRTIQVTGVVPDAKLPPKLDGKMPLGFREENLNNHLDPIEGNYTSPMSKRMPKLSACAKEHGTAHAIATREKNPQIQPDYQLLQAVDYLGCLAGLPTDGSGRGKKR